MATLAYSQLLLSFLNKRLIRANLFNDRPPVTEPQISEIGCAYMKTLTCLPTSCVVGVKF